MEVNPRVKKAEYAVRGPVVARAQEIEEQLKRGDGNSFPFKKVIYCNIGNPHALGQTSVSFIRQVLAVCVCPTLLKHPELFSAEVFRRAKEYLDGTSGGVGAYTETMGLAVVRRQVGEFIERRDGYKADMKRILLTNGASDGIRRVIQLLISDQQKEGLMIPCPQYPLYSCQIVLSGGEIVYYATDEQRGWGVSREELERQYSDAVSRGINIKGIVVINPGNPTGGVLNEQDISDIVNFAQDKNIAILADEVYQANVYSDNKKFVSFKKVVCKLKSTVPLFSFHSTSKGIIGECGLRAGYMEVVNLNEEIFKQLVKVSASQLSSNTLGQIACGLMVTPPADKEALGQYLQETSAIFESLKRRAAKVSSRLKSIPGFSFPSDIEGAMYAFPNISISISAQAAAARKGIAADEFYCMELLEATGIVCVPGSGFGQEEGTFHFRTTILPSEADIDNLLDLLAEFHSQWTRKYM